MQGGLIIVTIFDMLYIERRSSGSYLVENPLVAANTLKNIGESTGNIYIEGEIGQHATHILR